MPSGNHHYTPHGFWHETPARSTVPVLVLKSCRNVALLFSAIVAANVYHDMQKNITYTAFMGKTITLKDYTKMTHEPASAETIDRMKAEEAAHKKKY